MEKIISPEERIRRAEEIYYRRRQGNNAVRMSSSQVKQQTEKKQFSFYKKMVLQILICILIYLIFSLIKEANYLFSENVIGKTKEFLNTDINFEVVSNQIGQFFKGHQDSFSIFGDWLKEENDEPNNQEENVEDQNNEQVQNSQQNVQAENKQQEQVQNQTNTISNEENQNSQATGIGGGNDQEETVATSSQGSSNKTQMQLDADYIKANFSMQLPVKGEITSQYGKRQPTEIISENHQGIDIGVVTGTTVYAAMEGKVSVVSDEGSYGTHVKIVNQDVTTIYAHCSKILVEEGDTIKKGQKIALSGNTGNTTGPHLHFEIRRQERTVDPELVLKWT